METNKQPLTAEEILKAIESIADEFAGMPNARNLSIKEFIIGQTKPLLEEISKLKEQNKDLAEALEEIKTEAFKPDAKGIINNPWFYRVASEALTNYKLKDK